MSFFTEVVAFLVTGSAKYGRDYTPLDKMNDQANRGLEFLEDLEESKHARSKSTNTGRLRRK